MTGAQEAARATRALGFFNSCSSPRPWVGGLRNCLGSVLWLPAKGVAVLRSQSLGDRRLRLPLLWGSFYLGLSELQRLGGWGGGGSECPVRLDGSSWLAQQLLPPSAAGTGREPHLCPVLPSLGAVGGRHNSAEPPSQVTSGGCPFPLMQAARLIYYCHRVL